MAPAAKLSKYGNAGITSCAARIVITEETGENIRKVIMNFETKDYPLKSKGFITSIQIWDTEGFVMN